MKKQELDYKYFDELGFEGIQINQLMKMKDYYDVHFLITQEFITPMTNIELLRKFNKLIQDKSWEARNKKDKSQIIELMKKNIDFTPIADITLSPIKKETIFTILIQDISYKNELIKAIFFPNLKDEFVKDIIWEDMEKRINPLKYLKEEYQEGQIYMAHDAYIKNYPEILAIVKDLSPDFNNIELAKYALKEGLDIIQLSNTQNPELLEQIFIAKVSGFHIDKYLNKQSSINKYNYVLEMMKRGYTSERIFEYLEKYPLNKYRIPKERIAAYLDLIEHNIDPDPFLQCGKSPTFVKQAISIMELMDEKEKKHFIDKIHKCNEDKLLLMKTAADKDRMDVLKALIYCENLNESVCFSLECLLDYDKKYECHHDIINILYDKGNDAFKTFEQEYEFSTAQKSTLLDAIIARKISDENIDIIRNNRICANNMQLLIDLIAQDLDISFPLKYAETLGSKDLSSICNCIKLGLHFMEEQEKNIDK